MWCAAYKGFPSPAAHMIRGQPKERRHVGAANYDAPMDEHILALGEGLTSGQATIIAACMALAAATIALLGVLIKARYDKVQHREKILEDRKIRRRAEATEAIIEALTVANRSYEMVSSDNPSFPRNSDTYKDRDSRYYACVTVEVKLQVLDLEEAYLAMMRFNSALALHWILADEDGGGPHPDTFKRVCNERAALPYSLRDALVQLDQPKQRRRWMPFRGKASSTTPDPASVAA